MWFADSHPYTENFFRVLSQVGAAAVYLYILNATITTKKSKRTYSRTLFQHNVTKKWLDKFACITWCGLTMSKFNELFENERKQGRKSKREREKEKEREQSAKKENLSRKNRHYVDYRYLMPGFFQWYWNTCKKNVFVQGFQYEILSLVSFVFLFICVFYLLCTDKAIGIVSKIKYCDAVVDVLHVLRLLCKIVQATSLHYVFIYELDQFMTRFFYHSIRQLIREWWFGGSVLLNMSSIYDDVDINLIFVVVLLKCID